MQVGWAAERAGGMGLEGGAYGGTRCCGDMARRQAQAQAQAQGPVSCPVIVGGKGRGGDAALLLPWP